MTILSDYRALLSGSYWYPGAPAGQGVFLTYSFSTQPASGIVTSNPAAATTFQPLPNAAKDIVRAALQAWSAVSGITFIETTRHEGDLTFGYYDLTSSGAAGIGTYPDSGAFYDSSGKLEVYSGSSTAGGDVRFDLGYFTGAFDLSDLNHTALHEIGHALGLKHPFDGTDTLAAQYDNGTYTVMSYNPPRSYVLGPLDIAAIQQIYGTPTGATHPSTWSWDPATETFTTTAAGDNQFLRGPGANDIVFASGTNDAVVTSSGDDIIHANGQPLQINTGAGNDQVYTGLTFKDLQFGVGGSGDFRYIGIGSSFQAYNNVEKLIFSDGVYDTATNHFTAAAAITKVLSTVASPAGGVVATGTTVTLTITMSASVTVSGGTPSLTMNDGGIATYDATRSGGAALVFNHVIQSGQNAAALAVLGFSANGATILDALGGSADLTGAPATFTGLQVNVGVIDNLSADQQLELIYIGYFNRAAEAAGFNFWQGQNTLAKASGQSPAAILINVANSFTPQPETVALYPFLGTDISRINLRDPTTAASIGTLIDSVYTNLFVRPADAAGKAYWLNQLTSGAVTLGAAILAISNGATGTDSIELLNKITVAADFTTRTAAAGLGQISSSPNSFRTAARNVLLGVDGKSLNDASVVAGESATTAFIRNPGTVVGAAMASLDPVDATITISGSHQLVDPGAGGFTIQFLGGTNDDALVLHANGTDDIFGFDPATDVLDLHSLLNEANIDLTGGIAELSHYVTLIDQGMDALIGFTAPEQNSGLPVAVLRGAGNSVTGLDTLIAHGAVRIA